MKGKNLFLSVVLMVVIVLVSCQSDKKQRSSSTPVSKLIVLSEKDYRPTYHFSPKTSWMNDPNGMVYYDGEYHLFYQYYPDGNVWGPMHWGHTVSKDMLHWKDLPIALHPDELGYIFSGSAVVDKNNTSNLKNGEEDLLVAVFSHHHVEKEKAGTSDHQYQSIAYSNDKGRSWIKYDGNPVLPNIEKINDFRDPKVVWYEKGEKWVMALAAYDRIKFYSSFNLIDWVFESDFGVGVGSHDGVWECPDLFPLTTKEGTTKWVLLVSINMGGINGGSATQYFVGDFDGSKFISSQKNALWLDYGTDNYAGVTWSDIPEKDGRRIFLGWMSNWHYGEIVPTETWRSAMTLPRTLRLFNTPNGLRVASYPVKEIKSEREEDKKIKIDKPQDSIYIENSDIIRNGAYEVIVSLNCSNGANGFEISTGNKEEKLMINYDKRKSLLTIDRSEAGYDFKDMNKNIAKCPFTPHPDGIVNLRFFVDKTSLELFVDNGEKVMTSLFFPKYEFHYLKIKADSNSKSFVESFQLYPLSKTVER